MNLRDKLKNKTKRSDVLNASEDAQELLQAKLDAQAAEADKLKVEEATAHLSEAEVTALNDVLDFNAEMDAIIGLDVKPRYQAVMEEMAKHATTAEAMAVKAHRERQKDDVVVKAKFMRFIERNTREVVTFDTDRSIRKGHACKTGGFSAFCRERGLDHKLMYQVWNGNRKSHKEWIKWKPEYK